VTIDPGRPVLLLVDDERQILSALVRVLRREGYELLTAETPREALQIAQRSPIDCVLSDLKMPGMTGLELIERVAALRPRAACLLITGGNAEVDRIDPRQLARLGIRRVLTKPWDDSQLKLALRGALDRAGCAGV